MKFTTIGFEIKRIAPGAQIYVDDSGCRRHEPLFEAARKAIGLNENKFELLDVCSSAQLDSLLDMLSGVSDARLLVVQLPTDIALQPEFSWRYSQQMIGDEHLDHFVQNGLDVCDADALFTILTGSRIVERRGSASLFQPDEICEALELAQFASIFEPEHSPYVVVRTLLSPK